MADAHLAWVCITGMAAVTADWRLVLATTSFFAGYLWMALEPTADPQWVSALTNGTLLLTMVLIWMRPNEDLPALGRFISRRPPQQGE